MLFSFFTERRRENLVGEPFPEAWLPFLDANVPHYAYLSEAEQSRLRDDLRIFREEKNWEGCGGLTLTDEIQVTIAAQACLLTLGLENHDYYPKVESVLVYPAAYKAPEREVGDSGVVDERSSSVRLGEAWMSGQVVLSWADARAGGQNPGDGHNVVFHEFAHTLDMADGTVEGTPRLHSQAQYDEWYEVMTQEYERLIEESRQGGSPEVLSDYGANDAGEFFAVVTEAFFEKPRQLRRRHKRLYHVLRGYYRQDTAARVILHLRRQPRHQSAVTS